jgi:hypothetical protein
MKSSHKGLHKTLGAWFNPDRAEDLLQFWANMADPLADEFGKDVESLLRLCPEIFRELSGSRCLAISQGSDEDREDFFHSVWGLREHLRSAWRATDLREREWYIYELRRLYVRHAQAFSAPTALSALEHERDRLFGQHAQSQLDLSMQQFGADFWNRSRFWGFLVYPPPALTTFERVMFHFQRIAHFARKCENSECTAPYFFIRKKGQKYCTAECALPAQRKAKSEWWARNREEQTKKRRQDRKTRAMKPGRSFSKQIGRKASVVANTGEPS